MLLQTGNGSHNLLFDPDSLGWDVGPRSVSRKAIATERAAAPVLLPPLPVWTLSGRGIVFPPVPPIPSNPPPLLLSLPPDNRETPSKLPGGLDSSSTRFRTRK